MYIVSACLAGVKCRYDGNNNTCEHVRKLVEQGKAMLVCPEVLGGLPTPRIPCEIQTDEVGNIKIQNKEGKDCTEAFLEGARKTVEIAKIVGATKAIMKAKSPSCGCGKIYDGSFSGSLIEGDGICVSLLKKQGVKVYTELEWKKMTNNQEGAL